MHISKVLLHLIWWNSFKQNNCPSDCHKYYLHKGNYVRVIDDPSVNGWQYVSEYLQNFNFFNLANRWFRIYCRIYHTMRVNYERWSHILNNVSENLSERSNQCTNMTCLKSWRHINTARLSANLCILTNCPANKQYLEFTQNWTLMWLWHKFNIWQQTISVLHTSAGSTAGSNRSLWQSTALASEEECNDGRSERNGWGTHQERTGRDFRLACSTQPSMTPKQRQSFHKLLVTRECNYRWLHITLNS